MTPAQIMQKRMEMIDQLESAKRTILDRFLKFIQKAPLAIVEQKLEEVILPFGKFLLMGIDFSDSENVPEFRTFDFRESQRKKKVG
jgi:hypothetical protein